MKNKVLSYFKRKITNQYPNYSSEKIDEIMYGVEGIYLTFEKAIIIFLIAAVLGIFKNIILLLIAFNTIRVFAFGVHASKSFICLISSSALFLTAAFLCKVITINTTLILILYPIFLFLMLLFAPADTVKRPLINKKKRIRFKTLSVLITIIYFIISILFIKNNELVNYLLFGLIIECILINPITYKLFNTPYNNYKKMV